MRKIKFKAWDGEKIIKQQQEFVYNLLDPFNDLTKGVKVMQYIGIEDNEDKEIYEGDIVEFGQSVKGKGVIVYAGAGFKIDYNNDLLDITFYTHMKKLKVIGNKYSDPDLLNEKKIKKCKVCGEKANYKEFNPDGESNYFCTEKHYMEYTKTMHKKGIFWRATPLQKIRG